MSTERTAVAEGQRRIAAFEARLPPHVRLEGTAGRILSEALLLFAEKGFAGTSIRDLANACGIRSASLYSHFPTKEHMLAELARIGHEEHHARLTAAATAAADPASRLRDVVRAHVLAHAQYPLLAIVADNELHSLSPELAEPIMRLRDTGRRLLLGILDDGLARGVFDVPDSYLALTAISGMGMRVANWYGPDTPYTPDQVADSYAEFALRLAGTRQT
ncbi:TetR/AcrR family transcriptional regulator [Actinocorallia sp. B10E7]|uniref:TetR/AcrR family transcriptional regulator n=1 Tax=Actinocorallia sp. B10E7 TaxID=3153558 RepID=UPI00325D7912